MAGQGQRDTAIALKDTFGKTADDITSKAADFHDITAGASLDGAHAFQDADSGLKTKFNGMGDGAPATPTANADVDTDTSGGTGTSAGSGPVEDSFGSGGTGGQDVDGNEGTNKGGDPVDVVSGQMLTSAIDIVLPGVLPLVLRRAYASDYRHGRLFGPGWSSTQCHVG
jgi:hypothetical protein